MQSMKATSSERVPLLSSGIDDVLPPGTHRIEPRINEVALPNVDLEPNRPVNWSTWRKSLHMSLMCSHTILIFAIMTIATPLWTDITISTKITYVDLNCAYAINSAAMGIGCLLLGPLLLNCGRRPPYVITSIFLIVSALWQGIATTGLGFIMANIVAGLAGSVNDPLFQSAIADLYSVHQRATANGLYLASIFTGCYLGPPLAGYVAVVQNWTWVYYFLAVFATCNAIAIVFAFEESKISVTILDQSDAMSVKSVQVTTQSAIDVDHVKQPRNCTTAINVEHTAIPRLFYPNNPWTSNCINSGHHLSLPHDSTPTKSSSYITHIYQPLQVLIQFPAVAFTALQYGWLVSVVCLVAVTQATLYPAKPYNFTSASVGLMSLPPLFGSVLGSILSGPIVDTLTARVAHSRGGIHEPETRLWLFPIPGAALIVGSCLYGLTIAQGLSWTLNATGAALVGFALGGCGDMALTYVQDSYQDILPDALVGIVFVRNITSAALTLSVPACVAVVGVYNLFVFCAVMSAVMVASCLPLVVYGRRLRVSLAGKYEEFARQQH